MLIDGRKPYMTESSLLSAPHVQKWPHDWPQATIERWHTRLKKVVDKVHFTIFDIFAVLKEEQALHVEMKLASSSL